ncbi:MAG: hypothetical protein M3440_14815 [Chloroflexota bacterium]|nr:hypothetical protein [Chloroflexota bacterium]
MTTTPQPEPIDRLVYATAAFGMTPENGYTPDIAFRVVEGDEGREMRVVWRDGGTLRYRTLTRHQVRVLRRWFDEHEAVLNFPAH